MIAYKYFLGLSLIFCSLAAHGQAEILLDCNTSGGPDQQVTVVSQNGQLILKELTSSGRFIQRELSPSEWTAQKLNLSEGEFGEKTTLTKTVDGWYFHSESGGGSESGFADCH